MGTDQQGENGPDEKFVEYDYPLFYPTAEKFGVAGGLILIPFIAALLIGISHVIPGEGGGDYGGGAWISVALLIAAVPLYLSGMEQYLCHLPFVAIPIILLASYFVACLVVGRKISNIILAIAVYLLLLAVIFKLISFIYLPLACGA